MSNKKSIQRWKTRKTRSKYRKPIMIIFLPSITTYEAVERTREHLMKHSVAKDYHILVAISSVDETKVEVHGAARLTSFGIQELTHYVKEQLL